MRRVSLSVLLLYQRVQPPVYKLQPHPTLTFTRLSYQRRSQGSFIFATRFTKSSNFLLAKVSPKRLSEFSLLNFDSRQSGCHIWRRGGCHHPATAAPLQVQPLQHPPLLPPQAIPLHACLWVPIIPVTVRTADLWLVDVWTNESRGWAGRCVGSGVAVGQVHRLTQETTPPTHSPTIRHPQWESLAAEKTKKKEKKATLPTHSPTIRHCQKDKMTERQKDNALLHIWGWWHQEATGGCLIVHRKTPSCCPLPPPSSWPSFHHFETTSSFMIWKLKLLLSTDSQFPNTIAAFVWDLYKILLSPCSHMHWSGLSK